MSEQISNGTAFNIYYSENNIFRNICQIPSDGVQNETYSEIFKSKGGGTIRQANNNIWHIDFDECREIAKKAGIIDALTRALRPILAFLFPGVPKNHKANEYMAANIISNGNI